MAGERVNYHVSLGPLRISFQRSVKLKPDDSPRRLPGHGALPVIAYASGAIVVPVRDEESVWLGFETDDDEPVALRVLVSETGNIDAISGQPAADRLENKPQNYVVVPPQHWIDGVTVSVGESCARQFVRVADSPYHFVVEEFLFHGVRLQRRFSRPQSTSSAHGPVHRQSSSTPCKRLGHAEHIILPDPYGVGAWNGGHTWDVRVRLVSSEEFHRLTGLAPPGPADVGSSYKGWKLP